MKRILLVAVVALITLSASAVDRKRTPLPKFANEKKTILATPNALKNFAANQKAMMASYSDVENKTKKTAFISNAPRREEGELELIPSFSEWTYYYSSVIQGFIPKIMEDGASYLVTEDGKAYLAPFANLGMVEGVLNTTAENPYADYGAQVYTFTSEVIATYTDPDTNEKIDLSLEPCVIENYTPYRSGETTFNAYYFPEYEEFFLPKDVTLALFDANGTETEVFDEYYVARRLDLQPQEKYKEYISKGTFKNISYYESDPETATTEGECEIYLGSSSAIYVKGADPANEDAWMEYDFDEEDESLLKISEDIYVATYNFYTDATHTATTPGVVVTVGLLQTDGTLSAFNSDDEYRSSYKWTDNSDGTTTVANTNNTVYGLYVYMEGNGGMFEAVNQTITITYEPAYDTSAIKNINTDKPGNYNDATYNIMGQRVNSNAKGLVIKNGKKFIVK